MNIRKAVPRDSQGLIELTALAPMHGRISLRVDRKPDFFALLNQRGENIVVVAEDQHERITGSFSATRQYFMIGNTLRAFYYLGDLKVNPRYKKSTVAFRMIKAMQEEVRKSGIDLFVCNTSEENTHVFSFFQGRAGLPCFRETSVFNVYQLFPKNCPEPEQVSNTCTSEQLTGFYSIFFRRYHFHPVISHIDQCINMCWTENGKIVAAVSLYDPGNLKQNVIVDYPLSIGVTLTLLRAFKGITGISFIPAKGDQLKILYAKYFGLAPGYEKMFAQLMNSARAFALKNHYHFLAIAIDQKDTLLNRIIKPLSRFNFRSHLFIASLGNHDGLLEKISGSIAYEDYSLV